MTSKESKEAAFGCVLAIVGLPAFMFVVAFLKAFVARQLWIWFIAPTFGLRAPGFAAMYGLTLFIGALWPEPPHPKETESPWWTPFIGYPFILLAGYVTHWLMVR